MIVRPKIRGFICTTAHPAGCAQNIKEAIDYVKGHPPLKSGPEKALIVGSSTGYGLASRIVAAFGSRASTIGISYEKPAENKRTATAGWYNSVSFERQAKSNGLYARNFNGDAFSDDMKRQVIEAVKTDLGQLDLLIYSLASPRRVHPKTGKTAKSVLKPKGRPYTNKSIDFDKEQVTTVTLPSATQEEIDQTIDVMGGEDWEMWVEQLQQEGCLASGFLTVAYSYVGPQITIPVYRNGTIGAAKDHLEETAKRLNYRLKERIKGNAYVSVNKALITQSSSAIPFIPLYFVILMKVMKEKGVHEDCIQQIYRLFAERLYTGEDIPVDQNGRIRIDDLEMREDVQQEVFNLWEQINNGNLHQLADIKGYHQDFLKLFGFSVDGVDYDVDVDI